MAAVGQKRPFRFHCFAVFPNLYSLRKIKINTQKRHWIKVFSGVAGAGIAALALSSCAGLASYTFRPIEAWVVDAQTGEPIEGAIVVANWQLITGTLDGPRDRGSLETKETVTDKNGRFFFDEFSKHNPTAYELWNQDPKILIFKPGYQYFRHFNRYPNDRYANPQGSIRESQLSGKKVPLQKFAGDTATYGLELSFLTSYLRFAYWGKDCSWKNMPKMILAMDKESRGIRAPVGYYGARIESIFQAPCGNPKEFFKDKK